MATTNIPEPWLTALIEANIGDPRNGEPSLNALARKAGLAGSTLARIVKGEIANVRPETIHSLAEVLNKKPEVVAKWVGQAWETSKERVLPIEAKLLTDREWRSMVEMIMAVTESRRKGNHTEVAAEASPTKSQRRSKKAS